ncbi:MAG: hypothetical protein ACRDBM_07005 [Sporomusa sp.]
MGDILKEIERLQPKAEFAYTSADITSAIHEDRYKDVTQGLAKLQRTAYKLRMIKYQKGDNTEG